MENNCGVCKKTLLGDKDCIKCSGACKQTFHLQCTPIQTSANISRLGATQDNWTCPRCSTNPENRGSFVDEVVTQSVLQDVLSELRVHTSQASDTVARELADLRTSMNTLSKQIEGFQTTIEQVEEEVHRLHSENSRLQTRNGNLWRTVVRLGDDIGELQQLRCREVGEQQSKEMRHDEISSPKAVVALGLSFLTVAGVFYLVAARMFNRLLNILRNDQEEV